MKIGDSVRYTNLLDGYKFNNFIIPSNNYFLPSNHRLTVTDVWLDDLGDIIKRIYTRRDYTIYIFEVNNTFINKIFSELNEYEMKYNINEYILSMDGCDKKYGEVY